MVGGAGAGAGTETGTGTDTRVSGVEIDMARGTVVAGDNGTWCTGGDLVEGEGGGGGGKCVNGLACIFVRE